MNTSRPIVAQSQGKLIEALPTPAYQPLNVRAIEYDDKSSFPVSHHTRIRMQTELPRPHTLYGNRNTQVERGFVPTWIL